MIWCRSIAIVSAFFLFSFFLGGCSDTPSGGGDCPFEQCQSCASHSDCQGETYCEEETGYCAPQACVPGEAICEGGSLRRCTSEGSGFGAATACESGVCTEGQCGCENENDCGPGEDCANGLCACPSEVRCGATGLCCGDGESCSVVEVCDDQGECEVLSRCQAQCEGEVCGALGDLCCEGDTPSCGPTGQCAPSCDGAGELCGDDFDQCCEGGEVCVFGSCRLPGEPCSSFLDCDFGEYCDQGLGRCMADEFPEDMLCRLEGDFRELDVVEKWSWTEEDIISIPVVGDVTGDGEPNVVINTTVVGSWQQGFIIILDGQGNEIRRIPHDPSNNLWGSQGRSNIALGDVTGNGVLDIIYASRLVVGSRSYIVAANGQGETIWVAHDEEGEPVTVTVVNGAITVADFDGDPSRVEVLAGAMLIDSDGLIHWNEGGNGPAFGSNSNYRGGVAVTADLTGDGKSEIITGRHAWTVTWGPDGAEVEPLWVHDGPDGYVAVADMDGNGLPEVILVASRTVRVLNGQTGELWCGIDPTDQACQEDATLRTAPIFLPGPASNNRGGPPTVADFDGDGRPEIGVAGGHYYAVFDIHRPGFGADATAESIDPDLLAEFDEPMPALGALFVRWKRATQDFSSSATGSSVFDFQGDGSASVVYSDECFMRVYSGIDGEVELELPNSTGTILEYPIIVDVDKNGRSEILVVANYINHCSHIPGYEPRRGLFVYEDPNDRWVRTRSIWNQHAYFIDNILDSGALPAELGRHWESHNTFRNNRQGEIPLNAPDVAVTDVQTNRGACPPNLSLTATIRNMGSAGIPAGLPVSLILSETGQILQTELITEPISPGGVRTVHFSYQLSYGLYNRDIDFLIVANFDENSEALVADCNPDTAAYLLEGFRCDIQN